MLAVIGLALAGCGQDPRVRALADTAAVIVAGYHELAQAADILAERSRAFCADPSGEALASTRAAWDETMGAWMRIQPVRFGPIRQASRADRLQFWPDPRGKVAASTAEIIAGPAPIDADRVAAGSYAAQGLPALAYLLYPGQDAAVADLASARRCSALVAIAANLATTAGELYHAWSPQGGNYAARLTRYQENAALANPDQAWSVLLASLAAMLADINGSKLGWPLGARAEGQAQPQQVESRRAHRSRRNIHDNLAGVERLFTAGEGFGIEELLRSGHPALATAILAALDRAQALAVAIDIPFYQALRQSRGLDAYRALHEATQELGALLQKRLPAAMGVAPAFIRRHD